MGSRSFERGERYLGITLLGVPIYDAAVYTLDSYARWDLLMSFYNHLPHFLTSPVAFILYMFAGLWLISDSYKRNQKQSESSIVGADGKKYGKGENGTNIWIPVGVVALIAVTIAISSSLGYSLSYKGISPPAPPAPAYRELPKASETVTKSPQRLHTLVQVSHGQNSPNVGPITQAPCSVTQVGTENTAVGGTCYDVAPPPQIDWTQQALDATLASGPGLNEMREDTPGERITVTLRAAFERPFFLVLCDHPCDATAIHASAFFRPSLYHTDKPNVVGAGMTSPLDSGQEVYINVRSKDSNPIKVLGVKAEIKN